MTTESEMKKNTVEKAFGEAAATYAKGPSFAQPGRRLAELASLRSGDRVLDIATGRGAVLFPALERVGPTGYVQGIDLAEPMVLATTADLVTRGITNASVLKMDAEHLEFDDSSFDAVLCGFGLMFMPNLTQALSEVLRVLKGGGTFAATTWSSNDVFQKSYAELLRKHHAGGALLMTQTLSTPDVLASALREAGFEGVSAQAEAQTLVLRDEEEWWERSGAQPQQLHSLTQVQRDVLRQEALELARSFRGSTGLSYIRTAVLASATSPVSHVP